MKRLLLILAICLIIALSALWGYLLIFGAPESAEEFFANFNFGNSEDVGVVDTVPIFEITDFTDAPTEPDALRQLTTKPVAGYVEVDTNSASSTAVYYIEAGTGHIFKLDLTSGAEERLSNLTIPNATRGFIAQDGSLAVVQAGDPGTGDLTVVSLMGAVDSSSNRKVITDVHSFSLTTDNQVLYSQLDGGAQKALVYNPETDQTRPLFTLPFNQATILWGDIVDGTHYFFPRPASQLEGYLYSATDGVITREPLSGFGLNVNISPTIGLITTIKNNDYISQVFGQTTRSSVESVTDFIPEKCILSESISGAICSLPGIEFTTNSHSDWYRGMITSDRLAVLKLVENQVTILPILDLEQVSGQQIDVIDLQASDETGRLLFKNRIDDSLWLYELP